MGQDRPLAMVTGSSSAIDYQLAKLFAVNGCDDAVAGSSDRIFSAADRLRKRSVEVHPTKRMRARMTTVVRSPAPGCATDAGRSV